MAFQRYASLTGSSRYEDAILLALKMENDWYRPEFGNWEDIHRGEPMDTVAWVSWGQRGFCCARMELMESGCPEIASIASRDAAAGGRENPVYAAAEGVLSLPWESWEHCNPENLCAAWTGCRPEKTDVRIICGRWRNS